MIQAKEFWLLSFDNASGMKPKYPISFVRSPLGAEQPSVNSIRTTSCMCSITCDR